MHTYGDWVVTIPATCIETGTQTRTCSVCNETETEEISATGHSYVDNVCSVCGTINEIKIVTADDITNATDKTLYYGKTVNYTCGGTNVGWRIFYAGATPGGTKNNIYLIADSYIAWDDIGTTLQELLYKNDTYYSSFNNVVSNTAYTGGTNSNKFINSPAKNWLKYARSTDIDNGYGYSSTLKGMIATAMMLDTTAWKYYCNSTYASYAIGGPTLDMFVASWNQTQETHLYYNATADNSGYYISATEESPIDGYLVELTESDETNNLYLFSNDTTNTDCTFYIASPSCRGNGSFNMIYGMKATGIDGDIFPDETNSSLTRGFRPIICLYSDVELTTDSTVSGGCEYGFTTPCEHSFTNGTCSICGRNCTHSYLADGICEICGVECTHSWSNGVCTVCEKTCEHSYTDGVCTVCGELECVHTYTDGVCTICGTECTHSWSSGTCTICEVTCTHNYVNNTCTICGNSQCIAEGTLITLADGKQVAVEHLTGEETLLVWNLETGTYDEAEVAYIINHGNTSAERDIVHLYFSDGTDIEIITDHGFYDLDLNKLMYINADNYEEFIGHWFVTQDIGSGNKWNKAQLVEVKLEKRTTVVYEVVTYEHLTCFTNGLLSISSLLNPFCNIFEVDEETLSYDKELMEKDIEQYGLFTYEDFEGRIPEYAFNLYNVKYLKVALGKGLTTWEEIEFLIQFYHAEIDPLVNNKFKLENTANLLYALDIIIDIF